MEYQQIVFWESISKVENVQVLKAIHPFTVNLLRILKEMNCFPFMPRYMETSIKTISCLSNSN